MTEIRGTIHIDRPPGEVFDFVADERNEPTFNPSMSSSRLATDLPIGRGTRFDTTIVSRGKPLAMTVEITDFDRPHRLASRSTVARMAMVGELTFAPEGGGTRMSWRWDLEPIGAMRLAAPLVKLVGARQERRIWTSLKRHLEDRREEWR